MSLFEEISKKYFEATKIIVKSLHYLLHSESKNKKYVYSILYYFITLTFNFVKLGLVFGV